MLVWRHGVRVLWATGRIRRQRRGNRERDNDTGSGGIRRVGKLGWDDERGWNDERGRYDQWNDRRRRNYRWGVERGCNDERWRHEQRTDERGWNRR